MSPAGVASALLSGTSTTVPAFEISIRAAAASASGVTGGAPITGSASSFESGGVFSLMV